MRVSDYFCEPRSHVSGRRGETPLDGGGNVSGRKAKEKGTLRVTSPFGH